MIQNSHGLHNKFVTFIEVLIMEVILTHSPEDNSQSLIDNSREPSKNALQSDILPISNSNPADYLKKYWPAGFHW